jgi:hypothetical protein
MDARQYPVGSFGAVKPRYVNGVLVLPGVPRHLRVRASTAQVNAGLVVLPALPGFGYRIIDAAMIAIGGAAATATSVDLLGTKAAAASRPGRQRRRRPHPERPPAHGSGELRRSSRTARRTPSTT